MAKEQNNFEALNVVSTEPTDSVNDDKEESLTKKQDKIDDKESVKSKEAEPESKKDDLEIENPPAPPKRPVSPITKLKDELKSAFPDTDDKIITAVLVASQGVLNPAFNALLYLSDPSVEPEIPIVPEPAQNQTASQTIGNNASTSEDERLARQLQKEFEEENRRRRRKQQAHKANRNKRPDEQDDSPDEFDQIKETFSQGLEEARTTLNGWVSGFAKKFLENENQSKQNPKLFGALGGSSFNTKKTSNFEEDPEIIDNNFNKISLTDNTETPPPALPSRKSTQQPEPETTSEHSDAFSQARKWQPLNSDVPVDSDAFLVTDSEDEENPTQADESSKKVTSEKPAETKS